MSNPVLKITGGACLKGKVKVQGSKNATLPMMASALLLDKGQSLTLTRVPRLKDTELLVQLLSELGMQCSWEGDSVTFTAQEYLHSEMPDHLVRRMRASSLVLGPLLARIGKAIMPLPGGCSIGARPVDLHLMGLAKMGADIDQKEGAIHATAQGLKGNRIYLDFPSVGATENLMMAASIAEGTTIIENAAREPEIINLGDALRAMGAKVSGDGSSVITIEGQGKPLTSGTVAVIPDRIVACTYLLAGVVTNGHLTVEEVIPQHFESLLAKLEEAGVDMTIGDNFVTVAPSFAQLKPLQVITMPYPGFPTDVQPQMVALMALTQGVSTMKETIFENRFMHMPELTRMGASIEIQGNTALITGVPHLVGAHVQSTDLRAGAALIMAGLAAQGTTYVHGLTHVLRGYENFDKELRSLGATVEVVEMPEEI